MKRVVIFSGGIDSTTLLYQTIAEIGASNTFAISFNYGQRHKRELINAISICATEKVGHKVVDISDVQSLMKGSALTDEKVNVPHGHFEDEIMKDTVVPNRNMIFLSLATAYAISLEADEIGYGAHNGDHAIYPDCRKAFTDAMETAIELADWHSVKLVRPYVDMRKEHIVELGHQLGVPYEVTWSCYEGKGLHCGLCATCVERKEAFEVAGIADPTEYENE